MERGRKEGCDNHDVVTRVPAQPALKRLDIVSTKWRHGLWREPDMQPPPPPLRSEKLDIRVTRAAKTILQEAARERHTTISQFVLDAALTAASEVLAERNRIGLNATQWTSFMEALDAAPRRHPRLERLLNEPTLFD